MAADQEESLRQARYSAADRVRGDHEESYTNPRIGAAVRDVEAIAAREAKTIAGGAD
jgi:hypothetical protein